MRNPWRVAGVVFWVAGALVVLSTLFEPMEDEVDRTINMLLGLVLLAGSVLALVVIVRKRVVLGGQEFKVCGGVRTHSWPRQMVIRARYFEDRHEVAKYRIAYPIVETADGHEIGLKLLAHRDSGGGVRRVESYVAEINHWAASAADS